MTVDMPVVSLGELIRVERRPVEVVTDRDYQEIGIYSYGRGIFHKRARSGLEVGSKDLFLMKDGDLILQITFAWEGAIALCSKAQDGLFGSVRYPTFRVDESRCFPPFLVKYLCTTRGLEQIGRICPGSAGRNRVLSTKRIPEIMVPLPPLDEQRRIVDQIESVAARLHDAQALRASQTEDVRRLLLSAFHKIADAAPRSKMKDVAPLVRRPVTLSFDTSYPELGIRSFFKGTFHKPSLTALELGSKRVFWIEPGDLLFSNVFAWEGAMAIAGPQDAHRVGSHRYIACVAKPGIAEARFLLQYFQTDEGFERIKDASPGGAGRNRTLGLGTLGNIEVPLPSIERQRWFADLHARAERLLAEQQQAGVLYDALVPSMLERAFKPSLESAVGTNVRIAILT